jgi:hypothetical protein
MKLLKKVLVLSLPAGLLFLLISALTNQAGFPVFMSGMTVNATNWFISMFAYYWLVGMVFSLVYSELYAGIKGKNALSKGMAFGVLMWIFSAVPNSVKDFLSHPTLHVLLRLDLVNMFIGFPLIGGLIAVLHDRYFKD